MNEEKKIYIAGIYNYCDRWCDKCIFTSQCLLFTNESKIATFEILNDRLPNADEMMDEIFDTDEDDSEDNEFEMGYLFEEDADDEEDDDFLINNDDVNNDNFEIDKDLNVEKTLIEELSQEYMEICTHLLETIDKNFNFYSIPKESIKVPEAKKIYENFEVVSWYHALIFVKIKRALGGKKKYLKEDDEEFKEISKNDMDGTAKVAAISVNNSLKALNELHEFLPEHGVHIVKLLSLLKNMLIELEKEFPGYKNFIRPGFDE